MVPRTSRAARAFAMGCKATYPDLNQKPNLSGRPLTMHERAFLRSCEAAGYEMVIDSELIGTVLFGIETDNGDPMSYPLNAHVMPETLVVKQADTPALRADLERIVSETKWDGREAVALFEAAGFKRDAR